MIKCVIARDWHVLDIVSGTLKKVLQLVRGFGGRYDLLMYILSPAGEYFWYAYTIDDDTGIIYDRDKNGELYPVDIFSINMDYVSYCEQLDAILD